MNISYVLPVYNSQNTIAMVIRSLIKQNIKPLEIIVIDDCSTDNTKRILKTFSSEILLLENNKRMGAAYCRNFGNSISKGEVIAVCDADYYYPNRSDAIKEFFDEYKDKHIFYSGLHLRQAVNPSYKTYMPAIKWDFDSKCPISHPTIAYKRDVIETVKYFELTPESDLYEFFLLEAHIAGFNMGGCQDPLMIKIEGNSKRKVDEVRAKVKSEMYKKYGINI